MIPFGILKDSNAGDTYALSTEAGPMKMFPALTIETNYTISQFDSINPLGADFVFVPAVHDVENPALINWITKQHKLGATITGVCDGVWVLAHAGLLSEKKAVGHWYSFETLEEKFQDTTWLKNKRYHMDGNIITTTGVTASIPISLAIVEAILGTKKAQSLAQSYGLVEWGNSHESEVFKLSGDHILTAAKNLILFWNYEDIGIPIAPNIDEVKLALISDSFSRTYKSNVFAITDEKVITKHGLTILPQAGKNKKEEMNRVIQISPSLNVIETLDDSLKQIQTFYGLPTAKFVSLQIEYLKFMKL
mgnify:CR=1 FL=1